MSEATDRDEETTEVLDLESVGNTDGPPPGRWRRRVVLAAVVVVLVAGGLVAWLVTGNHATSGRAMPDANASHAASAPAAAATTPPAFPDKLTAVVQHNVVRLNWQPAAGPRPVTQYVVFRDGKKVGTVDNATSWQDGAATGGHTYAYQVQAVDNTGVGSALSPKVSVSVPATPPSSAANAGSAGQTQAAPPPMPASWPSATGTGASGSLASVNGDVKLGTTGQVYSNMRVHGTIVVTACNVTIRNVEVDTGEPYTGDSTPDLFAIWLQQSETCGVTIDHVSTITSSAPDVYVTTSIRDARGSSVTVTNSKLIGAQLGILGMASGTIRGNYIELGQNMRGDHNDAIQGDGASNLTIDHNTLLNPNDQTSALALYTEYGNNTNVTVSNNLMAGGGYTCYCGDGATENNGSPARAVNVKFVNNVFWRKYFPDAGNFGPGRAYNPAGGGSWAGNVYMNADGTLTSDQVQQPAVDGG